MVRLHLPPPVKLVRYGSGKWLTVSNRCALISEIGHCGCGFDPRHRFKNKILPDMHFYEITPRCWYLVDGRPRPVTGCRKQYVFSCYSSDSPHSIKTSEVAPLRITRDLIEYSNLRNCKHEKDNVYDTIHQKMTDFELPFVLRFDYDSDVPCEVVFPEGTVLKIEYIHRLQQLVYTIAGIDMRIRMPF